MKGFIILLIRLVLQKNRSRFLNQIGIKIAIDVGIKILQRIQFRESVKA